jgi:hypothetical protein
MKKLRPNLERAKMATVFFWIMIAVLGIMLIAELNQLFIVKDLASGNYTDATLVAADQSDLFVGFSAIAYSLMFIGCAIVFIMWFRRAYFNLHTLIPSGLRMTEGWAAGAWFIPIYSLWGPFQVATDLFDRTEGLLIKHDLAEPKPQRNVIKGWWWTFWVAGNILSNVENQMAKSLNIDVVLNSCYVGVVATLVMISGAYFAIRTIKNYSEMEHLLPQINDVSTDRPHDSELLDSTF